MNGVGCNEIAIATEIPVDRFFAVLAQVKVKTRTFKKHQGAAPGLCDLKARARRCVRLNIAVAKLRRCHRVELRALCNEVPRTPPGPEGSNGIGIASGAADHPKFLSMAGCDASGD